MITMMSVKHTNQEDNMSEREQELMNALLKLREAFYVKGTRKALAAAFEETHAIVAKANH